MLSPNRMLSEMPTMIPPENDRGSFPEPQLFKFAEQLADQAVDVGNACRIMLADHDGKFRILLGIAPTVVFHEFTGSMPSCFSLGFERVRRRGREIFS